MSESKSLDELLNADDDREPLNTVAEPAANDVPTSDAAPREDAASKAGDHDDATGDDDDAPPASESKEPRNVPLAALNSERDKRRAHEQRVRDLEAELAAYRVQQNQRQQQPRQQPKAPDAWEDPNAAIEYQTRQLRESFRQQAAMMSEEIARSTHKDYDEVIQSLGDAVQANPGLTEQIWQSPAPALAAYKAAQRHRAMAEIGDPTSYREKVRQELLAEMQAENPVQRNAPRLPKSMAAGTNVGNRRGPAWSGPRPLSDLLNE
jgi:hypothetical protein